MKCREVKKYLEEYADNLPDRRMKKKIREHISWCRDCMGELDNLLAYKKSIDYLKRHRAPAGFLDQINRRIDEPSFFRKMAQFLFVPLKIKLPLESAAALATVLIVLYVSDPHRFAEKVSFPVARTEKDMPIYRHSDTLYRESLKTAEKIAPAPEAAPEGDAGRRQPLIAENKAVQPKVKKILLPSSNVRISYEIALLVPPEASSEEAEAVADRNSMSSLRGMSDDKSPAGGAPLAVYEERARQAESAKDDLVKSEAPAETAKRSAQSGKQRKEVIDEIKTVTVKMGGKILSGKYNNQTKAMEYVIVEIPSRNYPEFIKKLKNMGTLQNEAPEKAQKGSKMQQLKVLLINQ